MIVYDLQCKNGHRFEGWFDNLEAFEKQNEQKLIACPLCEDTAILRLPSTFAIKSSIPQPINRPDKNHDINITEQQIVEKLQEFLEKNFDDVGCDFAKEALKIHYGVSEPRNIRGVSTEKEEKVLKDEGIKFVKIPMSSNPNSES
jgi:hypothetical protein